LHFVILKKLIPAPDTNVYTYFKMNGKAVIFDMDGVLVDTEPLYFSIARRIFDRLGMHVRTEQLHSFVGVSAATVWETLVREFKLTQQVEELVKAEKEEQYRTLSDIPSLRPIEGIIPLLEALNERQINLSIASSSPKEIIALILEKTGLSSRFHAVVSGEDVVNGKPHPDIYLRSSEELGIAPGHCVVIEDSPHGVAGAHTAGMMCVGFQNRNSGGQNLSGADLIVTDFLHDNRQKILSLLNIN
jgi:HAD superfamily hydrolase (TIGR01509 family)